MTFRSRYYIYGVPEDGTPEFIMSTLDPPGAVAVIQKHRKLFGDRFEKYFYVTMSDEKRVYVDN